MENIQLARAISRTASCDTPVRKWIWAINTRMTTQFGYEKPVKQLWYIGSPIYELDYYITDIGSTILKNTRFYCKSTNNEELHTQLITLPQAQIWEVHDTFEDLIAVHFTELL